MLMHEKTCVIPLLFLIFHMISNPCLATILIFNSYPISIFILKMLSVFLCLLHLFKCILD